MPAIALHNRLEAPANRQIGQPLKQSVTPVRVTYTGEGGIVNCGKWRM